MGTFSAPVTLLHPTDPTRQLSVDCIVDSGASYSQMPATLLQRLGVSPQEEAQTRLADGREGTCPVGEVVFVVNGCRTTAKVIFGEPGAPSLMGAMTLEGLRLGVDPVGKRLIPVPIQRFLRLHAHRTPGQIV